MDKRKIYKLTDNLMDLFRVVVELQQALDEIIEGLNQYRSANGKRAIVSTIQVTKDTDIGELKDKLNRFSDAGFDDAVVMFLPGAPSIDQIRSLI